MDRLGNYIPPHVIKERIFVSGGAFLKVHQFGKEQPKKRMFFILNKNPKKDDRVIIVNPTTQIEKRKKYRSSEVLVEIKPDEYQPMKEDSIVDCESYNIWNKQELENKIGAGEIELLQQLPESLLKRLRIAVSKSKTLAPVDKRLVLGEEEMLSSPNTED